MIPAADRIRHFAFPSFLLLVLGACQAPAPNGQAPSDSGRAPPVSSPPAVPSTWAYHCPDGLRFRVVYRGDEATVTLPERELRLPPTRSASGARYALGDTVFWDHGGEARLTVAGDEHRGCTGERASSSEVAARLLGVDFQGAGQEPGWLVYVDTDRQVRWIGDYGVVRFATGAPERSAIEGGWTWSAATEGHELEVRVWEEPCRDAMSGRPFTHTVHVEVDGQALEGCGEWLEEDAGRDGSLR